MTEDIKVESVEMVKVCRVCLQSGDEETQMASIFDRDREDKGTCLYEKIERCGGIKILNDPELPTRICRKCNTFLTIADKFRIICINSDNYLREFVCKKSRTNSAEEDRFSGNIRKHAKSKNSATNITFDNNSYDPENDGEATAVPGLQQTEHDIDATMNYVDVDDYTEYLMYDGKEDDLIEEDPVDAASPSKTLGITSDDVDIIPKKSQKRGKKKQVHMCDICGDCFARKYSLEVHKRRHHDELPQKDDLIEEEPVNTAKPSKTLDITSSDSDIIPKKLQKPRIKEQLHICDICGNCFPRKYSLEVHVRRHRDERPYDCEICGQSFHMQFQLTRHMRKHTGKRPFSCQFCQRNFSSRKRMVEHEIIHRNERPFTCETCGKSFNYSTVLKNHILTHTGEKPFNCGICGKRFARDHHLRAHLETLLHSSDPRSQILIKEIKPEEGYFIKTI